MLSLLLTELIDPGTGGAAKPAWHRTGGNSNTIRCPLTGGRRHRNGGRILHELCIPSVGGSLSCRRRSSLNRLLLRLLLQLQGQGEPRERKWSGPMRSEEHTGRFERNLRAVEEDIGPALEVPGGYRHNKKIISSLKESWADIED